MREKNSFLAIMIAIIFMGCNDQPRTVSLPELHYAGKDTTITDSCQSFTLEKYPGKNSCGKFFKGNHWIPGDYKKITHRVRNQGPEVSYEDINLLISSYRIESDRLTVIRLLESFAIAIILFTLTYILWILIRSED